MEKLTWDPSVKSLTALPQVVQMMNEKLDWTQKLGDAFLAQQKEVMATVQSLRAKAEASGNLKSTEQQTVKTEKQGTETIYIVEPAQPEVIHVPTYDPTVVYGSWPYPSYPPYYYYPPGYAYGAGLAFATGVVVGAAIWGNCNWGGGNVNVNVNRYNNFNKTNINNGNWNHNVDHRKGVSYRDQNVSQKYNRGASAQNVNAREDFRGRADTGRAELQGMDKAQLDNRVQQADRSQRSDAGQTRDSGAGAGKTRDSGAGPTRDSGAGAGPTRDSGAGAGPTRDSGAGAGQTRDSGAGAGQSRDVSSRSASSSGGGFQGAGNGGATRAASARGGASRGGGGGGRGGGGRR
jgi:hypothetical protein